MHFYRETNSAFPRWPLKSHENQVLSRSTTAVLDSSAPHSARRQALLSKRVMESHPKCVHELNLDRIALSQSDRGHLSWNWAQSGGPRRAATRCAGFRGSWEALSSFQNCTRTMNQDGQVGRDLPPSSRVAGLRRDRPDAPMRECGALGEVALPGKYQRFMENRQFLAELPTDHEPRRRPVSKPVHAERSGIAVR
jgi:hypothetical protein